MLTIPELTDAREKLRTALTLIDDVKRLFLGDRKRFASARLLNDVAHLLNDEVAALDKEIGAKP
jgi:hypothetical protein